MPVFDALAPQYDSSFTHSKIGTYLRGRVHGRLDRHFHPGDHVLELGCGTGEDARHLADRGVRVTATDASAAMLAIAREKMAGNALVHLTQLDIHDLSPDNTDMLKSLLPGVDEAAFDGVIANFGPVNVLDHWQSLAGWLANHVKPGGIISLGVMGPLCLWEIGWHSLHGDFKTASRRLNGRSTFQLDAVSEATPVYYPGIARLQGDFAPWFRRVHLEPLGLFLPPSDVFAVIEKRPRLLTWLMGLEDRSKSLTILAHFADHYWIEFERLA